MISIIIPTYNEAANIGVLVSYLRKEMIDDDTEIIISDGGSTDNTTELAQKEGAKIVLSPATGRAAQLNYGANKASGDIFYFIHADTFPPQGFVDDIKKAIAEGFEFGRYRTKFKSDKFIFKINEFFTRFNWFICYGGDQTLFIKKDLFKKISGFNNDMLMMEDYDIVKRAKAFGKYRIFKRSALVSARKYENNSWLKVQLANKKIVDMYKKGASQQEMVNMYRKLLVL